MAKIIRTEVRDGDTINIYESGAEYNVTRGHLVRAPERAMFTSETSAKAKEKLAEIKRAAIVRGAARTLEMKAPGDWTAPNDEDVVEAIAEAVMMKALNPDNAKQVDAARFILHEAGLAETQTKSSDEGQQFAAGAAAALAGFIRAMRGDPPETIDGQVTDTRNELEAGNDGTDGNS